MQKYRWLGIVLTSALALMGCASECYQTHPDTLREHWMQQVNTNPERWTENADRWFLTGESNQIECFKEIGSPRNAFKGMTSTSSAMTTVAVHNPNFTDIQVDGNFQIQLVGNQEENSVMVMGPNEQVRQTTVEVINNVLCIHQVQDSNVPTTNVIVRIGIRDLHRLTNHGPSSIEGRNVRSTDLIITSFGCGNILLKGSMNLTQVNQFGPGTVTVIGAFPPSLHINVQGDGNVYVSGQVGIKSINHYGSGTVSVIGAMSNCLTIDAREPGLTTVFGDVNLKQIIARDSQVYVYWVHSDTIYIEAYGTADIGIAGSARNVNADLTGSSLFQGSHLFGKNVSVRTRNRAHANVRATQALLATASDDSSIYIVGTPTRVSRYTTNKAVIFSVANADPIITTPPAPIYVPLYTPKTIYPVRIIHSKVRTVKCAPLRAYK